MDDEKGPIIREEPTALAHMGTGDKLPDAIKRAKDGGKDFVLVCVLRNNCYKSYVIDEVVYGNSEWVAAQAENKEFCRVYGESEYGHKLCMQFGKTYWPVLFTVSTSMGIMVDCMEEGFTEERIKNYMEKEVRMKRVQVMGLESDAVPVLIEEHTDVYELWGWCYAQVKEDNKRVGFHLFRPGLDEEKITEDSKGEIGVLFVGDIVLQCAFE